MRNEQLQRILRKKSRAFFKNFAQRVFRTCSEGARCVLGGSSVGPRRVLGACSVGARWVLGGSCVGAEYATRKKDRKSEKRETVVQNDGLGGARWVLGGCSERHLRLKVILTEAFSLKLSLLKQNATKKKTPARAHTSARPRQLNETSMCKSVCCRQK